VARAQRGQQSLAFADRLEACRTQFYVDRIRALMQTGEERPQRLARLIRIDDILAQASAQ